MELGVPASVQRRNRGLERLNDLTVAVAIGATGLLGTFAIIAATTIPGHSDAAASTASSTDQSQTGDSSAVSGDQSGQTQFQQPAGGSLSQGGSTAPIVVSGGSR